MWGGSIAEGGRGGGNHGRSPSSEECRGEAFTSRASSKVHEPHLDEMHGPESRPYRPARALPKKPALDDIRPGGSKIFQPTDSWQSGAEFGASPRSTGGAPGHRGGWKKR